MITKLRAKWRCFTGEHRFEEEMPKMSGNLVIHSILCRDCGARKGWVQKL